MHKAMREKGFTLIELLVIILIVGILLTLVGMTYSGVQSKNRNGKRQVDINRTKAALESYYAGAATSQYPTLANLNDATWRSQNLKDFKSGNMDDPRWSAKLKDCTDRAGKPVYTAQPAANCYAYQVTASDGGACDNVTRMCAQYTLTALLEGGEKYVKSSLN